MNFQLLHDIAIAISLAAIASSIVSALAGFTNFVWYPWYIALSAWGFTILLHIYVKILKFFHRG